MTDQDDAKVAIRTEWNVVSSLYNFDVSDLVYRDAIIAVTKRRFGEECLDPRNKRVRIVEEIYRGEDVSETVLRNRTVKRTVFLGLERRVLTHYVRVPKA